MTQKPLQIQYCALAPEQGIILHTKSVFFGGLFVF